MSPKTLFRPFDHAGISKLQKNIINIRCPPILTYTDEFRPGKLTVWVKLRVESEFELQNIQFLQIDLEK